MSVSQFFWLINNMSRFKQCFVGAMCSNVAHNALTTPCKISITQGLRRFISNDISDKVYQWSKRYYVF